ncbi:RagB/SusD family nutrient uptake outer membrane protein [Haoranjiania flava]|uniref:RagB/SusD family nutrient uptake outer membrane protein n=1 Tax=Haoranjiania flava TaxID=1856322 RepID=A0AAE3LJJ3_9BACT|nr:RagB/SusD family nutrient uptake outer membrane protein [Haoranjiania flava]MCU7693658.1 RagB/SusD family nutrient uptake outer membrane protein [Haoranjiania flava]
MKKYIILLLIAAGSASCNKYLDIVPDNIATIDYAFNMRTTAEKFLFTCYSYMPQHSNMSMNPALTAGDEIWLHDYYTTQGFQIHRGFQNVVNPYLNFWQGNNGGIDLYQGIRDCNIFLENIGRVPDMEQYEKNRWIAEVKFLKAYYHFYLLRMYGPVPIIKQNLPITAKLEEVKVYRDPVDEGFAYVVQLLDEAAAELPKVIVSEATELGRITRPIALSIKAYVLVTAASPLFNGNTDYSNFKDNRGVQLFSQKVDPEKWVRAKNACKEAIDACEEAGNKLYYYSQSSPQYNVTPQTRVKMNVRNTLAARWNYEVIWGNSNSMTNNLQLQSTPRGLDPAKRANNKTPGNAAVPLKIAALFYSKNGVPIEEDKNWDYGQRFALRVGDAENKYLIKEGYTTVRLNFDRELRYYADLGFDGGIWYGQGKFDDNNTWFVSAKRGDPASNITNQTFNSTGIWPKKYVNYVNVIQENSYTVEQYPWPVMRLGNLYLLYAEALNEAEGPSEEVYKYLDLIRERAGLKGVVESWANHSVNPSKPTTKEGLREIIHRERTIEMMFEGQRYWDLRRWKKAVDELNRPITGWDIDQKTAEAYYRERFLFQPTFSTKDYLWPVRENEIFANRNTEQNPGW